VAIVIKDVRWEDEDWDGGGYDIHVLANDEPSPSLTKQLVVLYNDGGAKDKGDWIANLTGLGFKASFTPEFVRTAVAGTNLVKHAPTGVTVDTTTGVVKLPPGSVPTPPLAGSEGVLRNFLIRAAVTDPDGVEFATKPSIRVHLHDFLMFGWLTPAQLTVRRDFAPEPDELPRQRFSILAQFNDGVVGDITRHPGIKWTSNHPFDVHVVEATGGLKALSSSAKADISVTLPAALNTPGTSVADGRVLCAPDWDTQVKAELVGGSPGLKAVATATNIIFLSEGFVASEKDQFRCAVIAMVHFLRSSQRTRPYDLLRNSINYWMAFVPSREKGESTVYEMMSVKRGAKTRWDEVPLPEAPAAGIYSPEALVHELGLPTDSDTAFTTLAAQKPIWVKRYGAKVDGRVNTARFDKWRSLATRTLANERDTAFGLRLGDRPRAHNPSAARAPLMSAFRCRRQHLDRFFKGLVAKDGTPIGHLWNVAGAKDRPLVAFICAGARDAGVRDPNDERLVLALSLRTESEVEATLDASGALELIPYPIPSRPGLEGTTTLAHEFAHALGLGMVHPYGVGDEYGGKRPLMIPTEAEAGVAPYGNLQTETSLKGGGVVIVGGNIKWGKWHRIAKGAVLRAKPTPDVAGFRLHLVKHPRPKIEKDDLVRLRQRPLALATTTSAEFLVLQRDGDDVIVTNLPGQNADPRTFGAGDVVFVPRRGKQVPPMVRGPELMLVSKAIRDHVSLLHAPLNATSFLGPLPPTPHVCIATGGAIMRADNVPLTGLHPSRPRYRAWITGIYDGGHDYECGVYHPAGVCLMRRRLIPPQKRQPGISPIYHFCHVCRYILVDNLDPTLHGAIDDDYQGMWPEPD
jgi:hypothetical protein